MALLPPLCFVWRHSCYPSWTLLAGWPPGVFSISAAVGSLSTQPELRGKGAAGRDLRITWLGLHMSLGPTCASGELLTRAHQNALRMRRTFALFWAPGPLAGRIWFCVRPPVRPAQFSPTLGCDDECPFYARLSGLTAVQGGGAPFAAFGALGDSVSRKLILAPTGDRTAAAYVNYGVERSTVLTALGRRVEEIASRL